MNGTQVSNSSAEILNTRISNRGLFGIRSSNSKNKREQTTEQKIMSRSSNNKLGKRSTSTDPRTDRFKNSRLKVSTKMVDQQTSNADSDYGGRDNFQKADIQVPNGSTRQQYERESKYNKSQTTQEPKNESFRNSIDIMSKSANVKPHKPIKPSKKIESTSEKSPMKNSRPDSAIRNKQIRISSSKTEASPTIQKARDTELNLEEKPTLENAETSFSNVNTEPQHPNPHVQKETETKSPKEEAKTPSKEKETKVKQIDLVVDYKLDRKKRKREGKLEYYQECDLLGYDFVTDPVNNYLIMVKDPKRITLEQEQESDDGSFNYKELDGYESEEPELPNEPEQVEIVAYKQPPKKKILLVDMSVRKLDPKTVRLNYLYRGMNEKVISKKKKLLVGTNATGEAIRVDTADLIHPKFRKHKFGKKEKESAAKMVASLESRHFKRAFEKYAYLVVQSELSENEKTAIDNTEESLVATVSTHSENLKGFLRENKSAEKLKRKKLKRAKDNEDALVVEKTWYYGDYFKTKTDYHFYPREKEEVSLLIKRMLALKHEAGSRTDTALHSPRKMSTRNKNFVRLNRSAFSRSPNLSAFDSSNERSVSSRPYSKREFQQHNANLETSRELSRESPTSKTDRLPLLQPPQREEPRLEEPTTAKSQKNKKEATSTSAGYKSNTPDLTSPSMNSSAIGLLDRRTSGPDETTQMKDTQKTKFVKKRHQRFKSASNNGFTRKINGLNPYKVAMVTFTSDER